MAQRGTAFLIEFDWYFVDRCCTELAPELLSKHPDRSFVLANWSFLSRTHADQPAIRDEF